MGKACTLIKGIVNRQSISREEIFRNTSSLIPREPNKSEQQEKESLNSTLRLYRLGLSIDDIARKRKMLESTIEAQLNACVNQGLLLEEEFLDENEIDEILLSPEKFTPLKSRKNSSERFRAGI
jgi:Fic family protein